MEASSKQAVIDTLKRQNIRPLSVGQSSTFSLGRFLNKKVKTKDVSIFTRQLSTLISAGGTAKSFILYFTRSDRQQIFSINNW
jgi:type II secretory pathway component PulF